VVRNLKKSRISRRQSTCGQCGCCLNFRRKVFDPIIARRDAPVANEYLFGR
jgi:hypothetical protein